MTMHFLSRTSRRVITALAFGSCATWLLACSPTQDKTQQPATVQVPSDHQDTLAQRVGTRNYPSVFQAWNPLDMPALFPLDTLEQRLQAAAKHDLLWEEPVSQLSFNTPLVLGVTWNHTHTGLATGFDPAARAQALKNRERLLEINPNMVMLMEVRWRDAPGSYLPEDSDFWLRNDDGTRVAGWKGGPEPYYMLNYENPEFQDRVAEMSRISVESGVFDGVMFDWSGNLDVIRKARAAMGEKGLITVNIHDDIEDGKRYQDYINGAFMECDPQRLCTWEGMQEALIFYEKNFRQPTINGLEVWGDRKDEQKMRAATALALTYSDGYVLYGDSNKLPTPDHLHDWYPLWNIDLGRPVGAVEKRQDGASQRAYLNGLVVYNPRENGTITLRFDTPRRRASNGEVGREFTLAELDGDFFMDI